jgi:hypothetical protein
LGGDAAAQEGAGDNDVLFKAIEAGDDALHADDDSGEHGTGSYNILVVGEGDDALHVNDDRSVRRRNSSSHWRDRHRQQPRCG